MMKNASIIILFLMLFVFACKEDCPLSECPENAVPLFSFALIDNSGKSIYEGPNSAYDINNLRLVAYYGRFSEELSIDSSRIRINGKRTLILQTSMPRASDRFFIYYRRNKFDEFKVQGAEEVDECCGSYYTGHSFSFEDQAITAFPYFHIVD